MIDTGCNNTTPIMQEEELDSLRFASDLDDDDSSTGSSCSAGRRANQVSPCPSPTHHANNTATRTSEDNGDLMDGLNRYDVVCGRDKLSHSHPGNKRFRRIIQSYRERYQTATRREEKTRITGEIVSLVEGSGGRFLKQADETSTLSSTTINEWVVVDAAGIHEKVSHALRSARDPSLTKSKRKRTDASTAPTAEENTVFKKLLSLQRTVFLRLLDQHCGDDNENSNNSSAASNRNPLFSSMS